MCFSPFRRRECTASFQPHNTSDALFSSLLFKEKNYDSNRASERTQNIPLIQKDFGPLFAFEQLAIPLLILDLMEEDQSLECRWKTWVRADKTNQFLWLLNRFRKRKFCTPADFDLFHNHQYHHEDDKTYVAACNLRSANATITTSTFTDALRTENTVHDTLATFFQKCKPSFLIPHLFGLRSAAISSILETVDLISPVELSLAQESDSNIAPESVESVSPLEPFESVKTCSLSFIAIYNEESESDADDYHNQIETAATLTEVKSKPGHGHRSRISQMLARMSFRWRTSRSEIAGTAPTGNPIKTSITANTASFTNPCLTSVATFVTHDPKIADRKEESEPKRLENQNLLSPLLGYTLHGVGVPEKVDKGYRQSENSYSITRKVEVTAPMKLENSRNKVNKVEKVGPKDCAFELHTKIKDSGTFKTCDHVSSITELILILGRDCQLPVFKSVPSKNLDADSLKCELSFETDNIVGIVIPIHAASATTTATNSDPDGLLGQGENPERSTGNKGWANGFSDPDAIEQSQIPKIKSSLNRRKLKKSMNSITAAVIGQLEDGEQLQAEYSDSVQASMKEPETEIELVPQSQPLYHDCECWAASPAASLRCVISHHRTIALMLEGTPLGEISKPGFQPVPETESELKSVPETVPVQIVSNYDSVTNSEHWQPFRTLHYWSEVHHEASPEVQISGKPDEPEPEAEVRPKPESISEPKSEPGFVLRVKRQFEVASEFNPVNEFQKVILGAKYVDHNFNFKWLPLELNSLVKGNENEKIFENDAVCIENVASEVIVPDSLPIKIVSKPKSFIPEGPFGVASDSIVPHTHSNTNNHTTNSSISIACMTPLQNFHQPAPQEQRMQLSPRPHLEVFNDSHPSNFSSPNISNFIQMIQMICLPATPNPCTIVEMQPKNFDYHYNSNIVYIPCNMEQICKQLIEMGLGSRESFRHYLRAPPKSMNEPVFISQTAVSVGQVPSMLGKFIADGAIDPQDVSEIYFGACPDYSSNVRNVTSLDDFVRHLQVIQEKVLEANGVVLSRWLEYPSYHCTGFEYSKKPYSLPNPPPYQIPIHHPYGIYSLKRRHPHLGLLFSFTRLDEQARRIKGRIKFELGIY